MKTHSDKLIITHIGVLTQKGKLELPLVLERVSAGFPSPTDDYSEQKLDLNELLIKHPAATFFMRVEGDSMIGAGIRSGDTLIVDRGISVSDNKIVVAQIDGQLTVKRIKKYKNTYYLIAENKSYKPIKITDDMSVVIWGVVTFVIHAV